jgi:hypothetical protein
MEKHSRANVLSHGAKAKRASVLFIGLLFSFGTLARADDSLPAVSEFNGKLSYEGGNMDSSTGDNLEGSFTVPVGHSFGAQADALFSRIGNHGFYGGGGHLFWRDPDVGLFGISGYIEWV